MTERRKAPGAATRALRDPARPDPGPDGRGRRPGGGLGGGDGAPAGRVPAAARDYLAHTEGGRTIRDLAREAEVHPSTIMRRVRRVESARDDPLVDGALRELGEAAAIDPAALWHDVLPVLRRLLEARTVLAVARGMELGVVLREVAEGEPQRLLAVDRRLAEAMALREWIDCADPEARVCRYRITGRGRLVLRRLLAEARGPAAPDPPKAPPPGPPPPSEAPAAVEDDGRLRHMRSAMAESPLVLLARRRDGDGKPFLDRRLAAVGERLREDFELGEKAGGRDWDAWLEAAARGRAPEPPARQPGPDGARARVERALLDVGPGLADVALRCCCLLEGLEAVEKRLGWSARSGKVVLRIALERLGRHYREVDGEASMIG